MKLKMVYAVNFTILKDLDCEKQYGASGKNMFISWGMGKQSWP
jgi:hypothetical protein